MFIQGLLQVCLSANAFSLHTLLSDLFEVEHYGHMLEINALPKNADETDMVNYLGMSCL